METPQKDSLQRPTQTERAAIRDGMAQGVMLGSGETYLGALGIFFQASPVQIALQASLPPFVSALSQNIAVWILDRWRSRQRVIVRAATLQALCFFAIALLSLAWPISFAAEYLILLACLAYAFNGVVIPLWNSLIGDSVRTEVRGSFLAKRTRFHGLCTFITLLICGQFLDLYSRVGSTNLGFFCIFTLAGVARLISVHWLAQYEEGEPPATAANRFSFWKFLIRSPRSNFARFVYFGSLVSFGVTFSAPFFAVYMLEELHFSYLEYTVLVSTSVVLQFLAMKGWGAISDRAGSKRILEICGYGVAINPMLWLLDNSFLYLLAVQAYSGFVWAGYNLATANFTFDAVSRPKLPRCSAYQAVVNGTCMLLGSLAGGYFITHFPAALSGLADSLGSKLLVAFLLSGIFRGIGVLLLLNRFQEVRPNISHLRKRQLLFEIIGIRSRAEATFNILHWNSAPPDWRGAKDRA
jgi:MFS family permease